MVRIFAAIIETFTNKLLDMHLYDNDFGVLTLEKDGEKYEIAIRRKGKEK